MKSIIVLCFVIASALSAPPNQYNNRYNQNSQYKPAKQYNNYLNNRNTFQSVAPQSFAPQAVTPKYNKFNNRNTLQSVAPQSVAPQAVTPKYGKYPLYNRDTLQSVAPQSVAPQSVTPKYNKYPLTNRNTELNAEQAATIIRFSSTNDGLGNYQFEYETSDGQIRQERGELVQVDGAEEPVLRVTGSYTYRDPDNTEHTVNYVADEDGFHPTEPGKSIPLLTRINTQSSPVQSLGILGAVSKTYGKL